MHFIKKLDKNAFIILVKFVSEINTKTRYKKD